MSDNNVVPLKSSLYPGTVPGTSLKFDVLYGGTTEVVFVNGEEKSEPFILMEDHFRKFFQALESGIPFEYLEFRDGRTIAIKRAVGRFWISTDGFKVYINDRQSVLLAGELRYVIDGLPELKPDKYSII